MPPYSSIIIEKRPINLSRGSRLFLKINPIKGFSTSFVFEYETAIPERQFSFFLIKGPCQKYRHEHRFVPWKAESTLLEDNIEIELSRFGKINRYLHPLLEARLDRLFRWRHHVTSFNIKLWQEFPFADKVHIIGLSYKTNWLTKRLKYQIDPIPSLENDPLKLTSQHGLHAVIFNAIGYTKSTLTHSVLEDLRRHHASVLICFYDQKNPAWLDVLQAYGDQVAFIQTKGFTTPFYKWEFFSKKEKWCCEEDLLSIAFQILHERSGYGFWHFNHLEPSSNNIKNFIKTNREKLEEKIFLTFFEKACLGLLRFSEKTIYREAKDPLFPLKIKAFSSLKKWKETCYRP